MIATKWTVFIHLTREDMALDFLKTSIKIQSIRSIQKLYREVKLIFMKEIHYVQISYKKYNIFMSTKVKIKYKILVAATRITESKILSRKHNKHAIK